ncbi:MAG: periplasmic heavy metal sensor [Verrucomicrobia bacterium]|nr:periplasmic heavy metal sensor [Verrucomicrobiota bacterium]
MNTKLLALAAALLTTGAPLSAQQPASSAASPDQPPAEQNRRPGPGQPGMAPQGRRDMNPSQPGMSPQPRRDMNPPQPGGWDAPQNPPSKPGPFAPPKPDPFGESFFPPELIMHNQQALNVTEEQRKRMIDVIQKAHPQFTGLQWQLEAEQSSMASLIRAEHPDEKQVLAQLDKVLRLENDMKRGQLTLLIRLKNELTTEQQAKLKELMRRPWQGR